MLGSRLVNHRTARWLDRSSGRSRSRVRLTMRYIVTIRYFPALSRNDRLLTLPILLIRST